MEMTYASSHRKGVSRKVWQTRQYYFNMLSDALDTFVPNPEAAPRDNAADSLIWAIKLVGAAIEADEPKDQPTCPVPNPATPTPPENTPGGSSISEDFTPSAADSTQTLLPAPVS